MRCPFCREEHPSGTVVCPKTQQRIAGILAAGTIIDSKYKIVGVLGTGGMAAVYRAEHVKIGRNVALKLLLPEFVAYGDLVQRVEREARAAGGIDHPNVVEIVDLGSTAEFGPYIAMEMLKGDDLATYVEKNGNRLEDVEAADIARQVLGALSAAHDKGVIHRDLKPENIFLVEEEDRRRVKVLDFGISKLSEQGGVSSLTRTGTVMGTPQYMAPEQAAGAREQDHRVDIYACGVVLYAILTGALPYEAENYNLLINDILNKPPIAILARDRSLDGDLADIVMKAIERNPADRYPTAKAMQEALVDWLHEHSIGSTGVRHRLSDSIRQRIPSAVPLAVTHPPIGDVIERKRTSQSGRNSAPEGERAPTAPGLRTAPTLPDPSDDATKKRPAVSASSVPTLRADTRTPLGWENTPAGTKLPPLEDVRGHKLKYTFIALVLLAGGAFAVRRFAPARWNMAVSSAGMPQFAVVTDDGAHTTSNTHHASSNNEGSEGHSTRTRSTSGSGSSSAHSNAGSSGSSSNNNDSTDAGATNTGSNAAANNDSDTHPTNTASSAGTTSTSRTTHTTTSTTNSQHNARTTTTNSHVVRRTPPHNTRRVTHTTTTRRHR